MVLRKRNELSLTRRIAMPFLFASALIALFVFYITFSWATITIAPQPFSSTYVFSVAVHDSASSDQLPDGDGIQGRIFSETREGDGDFSASGVVDRGPVKARGTITIVNNYSKDQPLRATTRLLSSDGRLFRTQDFVTVPAGGKVEVAVIADKEGDIGTLPTDRFTLPGLWSELQSLIYGTTFERHVEDASRVASVTQDDIAKAGESIAEASRRTFADELITRSRDARWTPLQAQTVVRHSLESVTADAKVGDTKERFSARAKVRLEGVVYDVGDLKEHIKEQLAERSDPGMRFLDFTDADMRITLEEIQAGAPAVRANLAVTVDATQVVSAESLGVQKKRLVGKNAREIDDYFASFEGITDTEVKFYPFWVTRAPLFVDHIHIIMKKP